MPYQHLDMDNATTAAYVAFAFLVLMTLLGGCFTYRLYMLGHSCYTEVYNYMVKIYYYVVASVVLLSYVAVGLAFIVLTATKGQPWADCSWRWSVGGALLDSVCTIKSTREATRCENAVYFQTVVAVIETTLVLVSPAIPSPTISKYLTFGAIICHAIWTALSTLYWTSQRKRIVRLAASVGQGLAAVTLIWTQLGFVTLFCICSIIIYGEELVKSDRAFWRINSSQRRTDPASREAGLTADIRPRYNVIFLGMGKKRTDLLRSLLNWTTPRSEFGGVSLFHHPTREDTGLASVSPNISLSENDKESYIRALIKSASAIVLVFDPSDYESFEYIKSLRGFSQGQPILLVSCTSFHGDHVVPHQDAQDLANQRDWILTTEIEIEPEFQGLLDTMFARPRARTAYSNAANSRFVL
ncbi:hypothetical protein F5Y14DRAFT_433758 [Nemania sp. NC0429]|nr:hypothetical protein F5Y14DRAFT_433758 [Nemania sp. NC0429]